MDALATIGSLTGLALASGVRLYSTILAVGLGIRLGFLEIPARLSHLTVQAETPALVIACLVYVVEFVADKIPWVDTLWDAVHTFIRPLGAAVIAATALGSVDPGVRLAFAHPMVALSLVLIVLTLILWRLPKVFRLFRRRRSASAACFAARLPTKASSLNLVRRPHYREYTTVTCRSRGPSAPRRPISGRSMQRRLAASGPLSAVPRSARG